MQLRKRSAAAVKTLLAVLALGVLAGCASSPRYQQGLAWVQSNEMEKARLDAAGFPQYSFY